MKKKPPAPEPDWATPQGIMKNLGKRPLVVASKEENEEHNRLRNTPGTPEFNSHNKLLMPRRN